MIKKRIGQRTIKLNNLPTIIAASSIVGPKEGEGPLKDKFDLILTDDLYGEKTWELAESKMVQSVMDMNVKKANKKLSDINLLYGGDLINQIFPSSFAARELAIPFFGIYGACSTMAEGLCLGSMAVDGGYADYVLTGASSHYCTAERQFRFPLELGNQKPMTAQWTVTGAGGVLLAKEGDGPKVKYIVPAKEEFIYEPRKLTTIIKITVGDVEEVTIKELKGSEKINNIINNIYRGEYIKHLGGVNPEYFKKCLNIAKNINFSVVTRPKDQFTVDKQIALIEEKILTIEEAVI